MNYRQAIEDAAPPILRRDAETLLLHVVEQARPVLLAHPERELTPEQVRRYFDLVQQRAACVPLQYLTGHQEFFGLDLQVTPEVLIPRPETELLVEAVLEWTHEQVPEAAETGPRLVDVGTGSGAIALALASMLPRAEIWAVDLSAAALKVAQGNAARVGLTDRVQFERSDLLTRFAAGSPAEEQFDVVVSNPPYVPLGDAREMQPEVRDHEPHLALFAGEDGMSVYTRLIPQARAALRTGGLLAMEFGFGQKEALANLLQDWTDVEFRDDYAGIPRIVLAVRP